MDRDEQKRDRSAGQAWLGLLALVIAAGLTVGLVVVEVHAYSLRRRGVTVVATVLDFHLKPRASTSLLRFTGLDGQTRTEWSNITRDDMRVGDQITVIYDPKHPSDVEDPQVLAQNEWYQPSVFAVGILIFLGVAVLAWMAEAEDLLAFLRRRPMRRRRPRPPVNQP